MKTTLLCPVRFPSFWLFVAVGLAAQFLIPSEQIAAQNASVVVASDEEVSQEGARTGPVDVAGAEWIWSPAHEKDHVPEGECYFRKSFLAGEQVRAEIHIAADNRYELFVNSKRISQGGDWRAMDVIDLLPHVLVGKNTIAVRATNTDAGAAGLVARIILENRSGKKSEHSTDGTWRTSVRAGDGWTKADYRDIDWLAAKSYGPLGEALPWGNEVILAALGAQFVLADKEFEVEKLLDGDTTGSLIAMAFDHRGDLYASQEGGPLLKLRDSDGDGKHDQVATFCDKVSTAQGILPIGQHIYVVGDGPEGKCAYALSDKDGDGSADDVRPLLRFRGSSGEHGAHAIRLGRDGLLYVMIGDHAQIDANPGAGSPYHYPYEGDLVGPRYEDPNGHAVGVPAPGGTVVRIDMGGRNVEHFAGGLRNAYDFAFLPDGELVTYDADMEWDLGAPWYRPTRINHVPPGAELGWRSGWAKWPEYYLDSLPAVLDKGPGSPTGVEVYDHVIYPDRYHGVLFAADWARGRIDIIRFTQEGASYRATAEPFLEGTPLNVTDLAIGPDGMVYFCTGGRGTAGGVYRVRYTGTTPPQATNLGQGIERALRQPQLDAPWAQSKIAAVRQKLGNRWQNELVSVALGEREEPSVRVRALDLLQLYGPRPAADMLLRLSKSTDPAVRARAVSLLGIQVPAKSRDSITGRLAQLTRDRDARVRRIACEAISRGPFNVPVDLLIDRLADDDRFVRFAARRALEHIPAATWKDAVLGSPRTKVFLAGAVGLLTAAPDERTATRILDRCAGMIRGDVDDPAYRRGLVSDSDFVDILRVAQLALIRGQIAPPPPEQVGRALTDSEQAAIAIGRDLLAEYPTKDAAINRELVRLLVYLQTPEAAGLFAKELARDELHFQEKLHIAAYASRLSAGWDRRAKLAMIEFLDVARTQESGYSVRTYVEQFTREFLKSLTPEEQFQVLSAAADWPHTALSILASLRQVPSTAMTTRLRELDQQLSGLPGDPIARLRVGIVAVLGISGDEASHAYLRQVYENEPDRRAAIAMGLSPHPDGDNWPVLIDSLKIVDGSVAEEVLASLQKVEFAPEEAEAYRHLILLGLRSREPTACAAVAVLEDWTGFVAEGEGDDIADDLAAWQDWYTSEFPAAPPATLPTASAQNKWSYDELLSFLQSENGAHGDVARGERVFTKAECIKCHRHGPEGETIGPDLSTVAKRFHTKEILESIVYPSHVISDQYEAKVVVVSGRQITGLVAPDGRDSIVVLQQDGTKKRVFRDDIDEIVESKISAMPDDILGRLTLDEVADLFAYLRTVPEVATATATDAANANPRR